jgi:hypothetical protein
MDTKKDFYSRAHLFVAGIRVFEHLNSRPPTVEELCRSLNIAIEPGGFTCRRLEELGVIEAVESGYGSRLFIRDHTKIEDIPRGQEESKLDAELKKFQDTRKSFVQKMETFQARQEQKKKDLFAEMEKKLKKKMEEKTKPS